MTEGAQRIAPSCRSVAEVIAVGRCTRPVRSAVLAHLLSCSRCDPASAVGLEAPEYERPRFPPKTRPCKDEEAYKAWGAVRARCAACGKSGRQAWPGLTTHHIVKPGRSHDPCNLLRLCGRCHDLAEVLDVRGPDGELLPKLTMAICLTIKMRADPGEYDAGRLEELYGKRLPDPEPIPALFTFARR